MSDKDPQHEADVRAAEQLLVPDHNPRRGQAAEIRDRRMVVDEILRKIPLAMHSGRTEIVGGSGKTWVVRGNAGSNLGQFFDRNLAQFVCDSVGHLKAFTKYIEQLEREAFENRRRYRRQNRLVQTISDELQSADNFGVHTKDGQRRVRQAIQALADDRRAEFDEELNDDLRRDW